jgi:hypothetical protein
MGSVTYRVLCLAHIPVFALPPLATASRAALVDREDAGASSACTVA